MVSLSEYAVLIRTVNGMCLCIMVACYPALVIYSGAAAGEHMAAYDCTSHLYRNLKDTRQAALGLFLVSILMVVMALLLEYEYKFGQQYKDWSTVVAFGGFVISGLLSLEVVLAGSCDVPFAAVTVDSLTDEDVEVTGAVVLVLASMLGILHADVWEDEHDNVRILPPSYSTFINALARFSLLCGLVILMSTADDALQRRYIDEERYNSIACAETRSIMKNHTSSLYNDFYKPIRLVDTDHCNTTTGELLSVTANDSMTGAIGSALAALFVELILYVVAMRLTVINIYHESLNGTLIAAKVLGLFQYVVIGLCTTSITLANSSTACSIYDTSTTLIMYILVCIGVVYGMATVHVALFKAKARIVRPIIRTDKDSQSLDNHFESTRRLLH